MSEQPDRDGHPVLWGLVALAAVTAVVGGLLAGGVYVAGGALGLGESTSAGTGTRVEETLSVPPITESNLPTEAYATVTEIPKSPLPTYEGGEEAGDGTITLEAAQTAVAPGQQIDLSGSYPGGVGATLQVQRLEGEVWNDFPVDISVGAESFATYVVTSRTGETKWRVIDVATDETSNEVTVQIG